MFSLDVITQSITELAPINTTFLNVAQLQLTEAIFFDGWIYLLNNNENGSEIIRFQGWSSPTVQRYQISLNVSEKALGLTAVKKDGVNHIVVALSTSTVCFTDQKTNGILALDLVLDWKNTNALALQ